MHSTRRASWQARCYPPTTEGLRATHSAKLTQACDTSSAVAALDEDDFEDLTTGARGVRQAIPEVAGGGMGNHRAVARAVEQRLVEHRQLAIGPAEKRG